VEQALAAVGLTAVAERPTHALSYGEKQRACLAGVLAMEPEVLILDEPDAGLDAPMAAQLLPLLDELHAGGRTVIVATHDVDFAYAWADEICVLHDGALAFQGPVTDPAALGRAFPPLGLPLPAVLELSAALGRRGLLRGDTPPRTRAELLERLQELD
jgi:cobalt/nickel transport system ATP-binding protein